MVVWAYSHLPIAMAIAAAGAGAAMVSLIEHAGDKRAPAPTAWLLTGATATVLVMLTATIRSFDVYAFQARVYRPMLTVLGAGALATLGIGLLRPTSATLILATAAVLVVTWLVLFARRLGT